MVRLFSIMVACALLVAVSVSPCDASLTLMLDDGAGNTAMVTDSDGDGVVIFNGALGTSVWAINVSTGISTPVIGTSTMPNVDLNSVNVTTLGAGSLTIKVSDDNFIGANPATAPGFKFDLGGTTNGVVAANAYASATNVLFAQTENVGSLGPFSTSSFSGTTRSPTTQTSGANYSLTIVANIQHTASGQVSSFDANLQAVPEPASIAAWSLLAMMGVGGLVWSRRRR